jgi:hypothetical protein
VLLKIIVVVCKADVLIIVRIVGFAIIVFVVRIVFLIYRHGSKCLVKVGSSSIQSISRLTFATVGRVDGSESVLFTPTITWSYRRVYSPCIEGSKVYGSEKRVFHRTLESPVSETSSRTTLQEAADTAGTLLAEK